MEHLIADIFIQWICDLMWTSTLTKGDQAFEKCNKTGLCAPKVDLSGPECTRENFKGRERMYMYLSELECARMYLNT